MISSKKIAKLLEKAEEKRVAVAGGVSTDIEAVRQGYQEIITDLQSIIENAQPHTDKEKLAIGQTIFTIATIYTSLALHGTDKDNQKRAYLQKAKDLIGGKLMQLCQPAMERLSRSVHDTPLLWVSEINRIKARIEERKPEATELDRETARGYYAQAIEQAVQKFYHSIISGDDLYSGALSVWSTALGEKALTYSNKDKNHALLEMGNVAGMSYSLYANGVHKDLDRASTVIARIIRYCATHQVATEHPTYQQASMLYLLLAKDMPKDTLSKMLSFSKKEHLNLPSEFISSLRTLINKK